MELSVGKVKTRYLGMNYLTILGLTFLLGTVKIYDTSLCFVMPLLLISFMCGYGQLVMCVFTIALVSFLFNYNYMILIIAVTSVILMQILMYFKFVKSRYLCLVITLVSLIVLYLYKYNYVEVLVLLGLTFIHTMMALEVVPLFIHNTIDVYTRKRMMILSVIILFAITSLLELNQVYMMIMIRFYLLLSLYYLDIESTMPVILYISIVLMLINPLLKDEVLALILPFTIFFIYRPQNKLICTLTYLLSHLILPFFIKYDYYYHNYTIIASAAIFLFIPVIKRAPKLLNNHYQSITNQNKLIQRTNTFSALFKQLMTIFTDINKEVNVGEFVGYVYEDVCQNCPSKELCFYRDGSVSRLAKLINKGFKEKYSKEDLGYINSSCINPRQFLNSVDEYRDSYDKLKRIHQENVHLKKDLFYEFSLLSEVFDNFTSSLEKPIDNDAHLKEHLEGYSFNLTYLNRNQISLDTYTIEIGLLDINAQEVREELVPIIETYLDETLEIVSIKDAMHHLGYTAVVLKHEQNYSLQYGFQQYALEPLNCGDSFGVFHQNNKHYLALSDGMGQGKEAAKESKLTLEVLTKLILNGVSLKDTLNCINTLLKIKNRNDMFTTLDLCKIDLGNAKMKLVKYGANPSYHIRDNKVEQIMTNSLPVGIISKLKMSSYEMRLKDNDILIMASDGTGNDFIQLINAQMNYIVTHSPQEVATYLMDQVLAKNNLDDISIVVIKLSAVQKGL